MVINLKNKTLTKRAQSLRGSITYIPKARNLAQAVRTTPGVHQSVTPVTVFNLPRDVLSIIDPQQKIDRYAAKKKPNLRHVPTRFPSRRGKVKMTRNQAARRLQKGAQDKINAARVSKVRNALYTEPTGFTLGRHSRRAASPVTYRDVVDYVRAYPEPTNMNVGAAVDITRRQHQTPEFENMIAGQIETYRPFLGPWSPPSRSRSSRRARASPRASPRGFSVW